MDHPIETVFIDGHLVGHIYHDIGFEAVQPVRLPHGHLADQGAGAQSVGAGAAEMRTLLMHPLMIFYGAMFLVVALIWIVRAVPA